MATIHDPNRSLNSLFFNPLIEVYRYSKRQFNCTVIPDLEFAKLGVLRCLSHTKTGHGFLQHHADHGGMDLDTSHFFKALQSNRRLANLRSLNELLRNTMRRELSDPFSSFEELNGFDLYAADGHYHHAATFDSKSAASEKSHATGHFFRLDLRSHHLGHINLGEPSVGKKRIHDLTVIKRADKECLRNHAPKGRKVLYAWDKACIDYQLWDRLKRTAGIYFLTREKSNSALEICSTNQIDSNDPRNEGITGDYLVGPNNGPALRRITYMDPADGELYCYITNEMTLPAYQLVIIYRHRWDIEKVFHQLKSKMEERKSWASAPTAKRQHAVFECLSHNLSLLVEEEMKRRGLRDEVEQQKAKGRVAYRTNRDGKPMAKRQNFIGKAITRATQRTVRFIRWLQAALYQPCPLEQAIAKLKRVWCLKSS